MDPSPPRKERIPAWRAALAGVLVLLLTFLTIGYHDGAFGTEAVTATDLVEGRYRFKGTLEDWDPGNQTLRLRDSTGAREFSWNVTNPKVGGVYVVDANVEGPGKWEALALTPILLIEGSWT